MMDTKTSIAAVILMTASIFNHWGAQNTANAFAATQAGSSNQPAPAEPGPWTPVCRYVGKVAAGTPLQAEQLKKQVFPAATNNLQVSTFIATIPNPETTPPLLAFESER